MVARVSRYSLSSDEVRALNDQIVRLARAHAPYDPRLWASILFVGLSGAAVTLTVADSYEGLLTAPTERHATSRAEVKDYDVVEWFIAPPGDVCPASAELRSHPLAVVVASPHGSKGVWARFLLGSELGGLAITVFDETTTFPGDEADRWHPDYFMVRHSPSQPDELQLTVEARGGLDRS